MNRVIAIDRAHLMAALQDPAFFAEVPSIAYLRDAVAGCAAAWKRAVEEGTCGACKGNDFPYYRGVVDATWLWLNERRKAGDKESLERFRRYFASRKRSPSCPVAIYYRRSREQGRIGKFTIE